MCGFWPIALALAVVPAATAKMDSHIADHDAERTSCSAPSLPQQRPSGGLEAQDFEQHSSQDGTHFLQLVSSQAAAGGFVGNPMQASGRPEGQGKEMNGFVVHTLSEEARSEADLAKLQTSHMHTFLRELGEALHKISYGRKRFEEPGSVNRSVQEKFETIYEKNSWGSSESRSGTGSTVAATTGIRNCLESWMQKNSVNLLLDIPCGDGNWQGLIPSIQNGSVQYYGYDISPGAVEAASKHNEGNKNMRFGVLDLVNQVPPVKADMIMVKEVIQHLPLAMGLKMLQNAKAAGVKWLAVTSNPLYKNTNIEPGEWFRGPNAQAPPFNFGREAAHCGTPGQMGGENDFMLFNLEGWMGGA